MPLDMELAARMDSNLAAYWGGYAQTEGSTYRDLAGALFFYTAVPHYLFNSVLLTARDPASVDAALAAASECIAAHGVPVLWRVSPAAATDAVKEKLEAAGLRHQGRDPAMLADLEILPSVPAVKGLRIETVEGNPKRHDWAWLTCGGFELQPDVCRAMSVCEAAIPGSVYEQQWRYTGHVGGAAVAVGSLVMSAGLAGVYAVATLPEARKRGIGTAMTLHAMTEGKRRGATMAVLQASTMGRPIYERIGFSLAYEYALYLQRA